ncbi:MAG TPA: sulfatase, partial [Planctomycetaceae bacterium]
MLPRTFATCAAAALTLLASSLDAAERPPNVVLILVDDLGWKDLGCQGSTFYETPHIDALARQGMRFTQAYAACAVCSPTRAAVLTGKYPARLGVTDWIRPRHSRDAKEHKLSKSGGYVENLGRPLLTPANRFELDLGEVTLAERLKAAGYATCHVGKWHLGDPGHLPTDQGFDRNVGGYDYGQPPSYFDPYTNNRLPEGIPTLPPRRDGEYLADREADEAAAFIRENKGRPFFLSYWPYEVHTPLQAKPELVERYKAKPKSEQSNATYAAMIQSLDEAVGRIIATLDDLGLTDDTLVVFTSDNGGLLGPTNNAPLRSGKGYPYEGGLRVPLLVRRPGVVPAGTVSDLPACSIDLAPTIC